MAHRRKSSQPVCKTRRNLGVSWETPPDQSSDDDETKVDLQQAQDRAAAAVAAVTMETAIDRDGQQIVLPSDLYKDFEAVRSQTKMDTTDLMRRLLRDYQSLSTPGEKSGLGVHPGEDNVDTDLHGNDSISKNDSIATDVSLATARVDTDEEDFQGLDLSVRARKITSQLFDTKSLHTSEELFDKPLDLTCSKPSQSCEGQNQDSPSSSQMDIGGMNNEFNYVYVYPGLYPSGSGMLSQEELDNDTSKDDASPVPDLIPPDQISPNDIMSKMHYTGGEGLDVSLGGINPNFTYNPYMDISLPKGELSPKEIKPPVLPPSLLNFKSDHLEFDSLEDIAKKAKQMAKYPHGTPAPAGRGPKQKGSKKNTEMKVISENTSFPGVYTSVMKLPWSRRTRTKKSKHKVKLEDTLVPQFMLEQNMGSPLFSANSPPVNDFSAHTNPVQVDENVRTTASETSQQSCMMVYPNTGGMSSFGKPVRKRGRPPKLPMLAKLLQTQEQAKRARKEKKAMPETGPSKSEAAQPAPVIQDPNTGQIVMPIPQTQIATSDPSQFPAMQSVAGAMVPNMAQAQFIGQFPLSQVAGGQIQFLGQFPAQTIQALHGQQIPAIPMQFADGHMQQMIAQFHASTSAQDNSATQTQINQEVKPIDTAPTASLPMNYQYAMQPVFIPSTNFTPTLPRPPVPIPLQTSPPPSNSPEVTPVVVEAQPDASPPKHEDAPASTISATEPEIVHEIKPEISPTTTNGSADVRDTTTTSVATPTGDAFYQEMILSSKSLVDVKKKKRKTAIQHLKDKSLNQDFLCTSFRIRPRLVAQAQAEFERQAAKGDHMNPELTGSKNLIRPQNDADHFGETNEKSSKNDLTNIQVKQEIVDDELMENINDLCDRGDFIKTEVESDPEATTVVRKLNTTKRFMLKGSQKRKAKSYRHVVVNKAQSEPELNSLASSEENGISETEPDKLFHELFNCKLCNKIIPVDQIEPHSREHNGQETAGPGHCGNCGADCKDVDVDGVEVPSCKACGSPLTNLEGNVFWYGHGKIACDECPETFKSLPEFYEHKSEEHKYDENSARGDYECDFCGKTYQYYHALQFHRRTHRERRVPCLDTSCDMHFRSRKEMENHFEIKHPDKKEYYHCLYAGCSKKFLKNFHLQEHIRVKHYNIKAFQCPWPGCVKEFAAQRHLKIHLLIHRDEKPMKCDHCDYRCRQRSAMNWHMRKHPDVPYKYKRAVKSPSMSAAESE